MKNANVMSGYRYENYDHTGAHRHLLSAIRSELDAFFENRTDIRRIIDLCCGNGNVAAFLAGEGYGVSRADPPTEGIAQIRAAFGDVHDRRCKKAATLNGILHPHA